MTSSEVTASMNDTFVIPLPLLPSIVERKVSQMAEHAALMSRSSSTSSTSSTGIKTAKRLKQLKKKHDFMMIQQHHQQQQHFNGEEPLNEESLLYNGGLVATEFQSHWLTEHYPQMLKPVNNWDDERTTYEKLLDIGTKLCHERQFEHALKCFTKAVPPNAADHSYVYALRALVKLSSEMYEDAVVDAATVMLIFLTNTMWHRLFPHFRLAFTNAHLVVAIAFSRLGYVAAAKAWADRFVCMSESLPSRDAESMLSALNLSELAEEVRVLQQSDLSELADFNKIRQINAEDLDYHAKRILVGGEQLDSTKILFSIVHISLNYGYFLTENHPQFRDEVLIKEQFHMKLLKMPVVSRILKIETAFDLSDQDSQFFAILSRFLLLPMCFCMIHQSVCEEMLAEPVFLKFLSTVAVELTKDNAAIICYQTKRPCFALLSPAFSTLLWTVWHRAPVGRARMLSSVAPFNDIDWHADVLLTEMGLNGPANTWLRLLDFFGVFLESFSNSPSFKAEILNMPIEKLASVMNKLSWMWSALFQSAVSGYLTARDPMIDSLEKTSDTALIFWPMIAKDPHILSALIRSNFWLHVATHFDFLTTKLSGDLLSMQSRLTRMKFLLDLMSSMLRTKRSDWSAAAYDERLISTMAKCLAEMLFVESEFQFNMLPVEVVWLLLEVCSLMSLKYPKVFPDMIFAKVNADDVCQRFLAIFKQPSSEAIFKAAVNCAVFLMRQTPEKIHRASKKLKVKDIATFFAKLSTNIVALTEWEWSEWEMSLVGACEMIELLMRNERCENAICSGILYEQVEKATACRYLNDSGPLTPPPDHDNTTYYDILARSLDFFKKSLESGKFSGDRDIDTLNTIKRLLEKLETTDTNEKSSNPASSSLSASSSMEPSGKLKTAR